MGLIHVARQNRPISAQVICRQLGFRFGGLYDTEDATNSSGVIVGADYEDFNTPGDLVWATNVQCSGLEERLAECFFPEAFGDARRGTDGQPIATADGIERARCERQDGFVLGWCAGSLRLKVCPPWNVGDRW